MLDSFQDVVLSLNGEDGYLYACRSTMALRWMRKT